MKIVHHQGAYEVRETSTDRLLADLPGSSYVITDENVHAVLGSGIPEGTPCLVLPPGEGSKNLETFGRCHDWLADVGASRKSTLVALGGGVIGDLVGFVAATYMRGIPFIQIPTTLLSQVDSSVGGKVGIDLPSGKNLVGAFHAPTEVRLDVEILNHLPSRQLINGSAEVWKYGAIMDADLYQRLEETPVHPDGAALGPIVRRCIALKAQVVEEDEFETTGRRAILNFGHTIGHAIEFLTGYGPVLHGEAIAVGMVAEARLGENLGITPLGTATRLREAFVAQGLPIFHDCLSQSESLIAAMRRDKKASHGRLAFSLLTQIGGCKLVQDIDDADVRASLSEG